MIYLGSDLYVSVHCHKEHGSKILKKLVTLQKEINDLLSSLHLIQSKIPGQGMVSPIMGGSINFKKIFFFK